jgi:hypothetical protein
LDRIIRQEHDPGFVERKFWQVVKQAGLENANAPRSTLLACWQRRSIVRMAYSFVRRS